MLELQEKLEKAEGQVKMLEDSGREEMEAVKFQMSSESMNSQNQIKVSWIASSKGYSPWGLISQH